MAMDREISRIRIGNQNKHAGKSGKNQRLNPNEKYINKISRIQEDVIIDIFYDFCFLWINLEFVIAEIIDAVHSHTTAK